MQGRLTPPIGNRIQAFPAQQWKKEFSLARQIGVAAIEWIVESPLEENPLWTKEGCEEIRTQITESGVRVDFVCADYFMEVPFVRMKAGELDRNRAVLDQIIRNSADVGVRGIEIPFVDASAIHSSDEEDELCRALEPCLDLAQQHGILIGLETSLPAGRFEKLLRRIDHPVIRANYDIGNSASLGYDPGEEIGAYGTMINNVHIKDRVRGGTTVTLGTGDADLPRVFKLLHGIGYRGCYTLQAARGVDEVNTVRGYLRQVNSWISS
jgi:L-ribulose-5-phosphate 3-epimerase